MPSTISWLNTLRPRWNCRQFSDDIFNCMKIYKYRLISLKFVPKIRINNIAALVQMIVWCRPGDKPLSEPMVVSSLRHICVTRPHCIKSQVGHGSWCPLRLGWPTAKQNTMRCSYNTINVLHRTHNRYQIHHHHGRIVGCLLQIEIADNIF